MLNITQNGVVTQSLDVILPTELDSTSFAATVQGNSTSINIACNYPPTVQSYFGTLTGAVSSPNSTVSSAAVAACKLVNTTCVATRTYTLSLSGVSAKSNT